MRSGNTVTFGPIQLSSFTKIAVGLTRPEDVVVGVDGRVFASTTDAAVAEIFADGTYQLMGAPRGAPNGLARDRQGRVLIANFGVWNGEPGGLERFDPASGERETLVAEVDGRRLTASNYPLIDREGNIWVSHSTSAPSWTDALDGRADGFIYVLRTDGTASIAADGLQFANGLALSADGDYLFCAQTVGGDVLRYPLLPNARLGRGERYGPALGWIPDALAQPTLKIDPDQRQRLGYTDGLGFDAAGNLWVTLPAANKLVAIRPDGEVVIVAHDPAGALLREPTNIAWGGPDLCDLYVGSIGVDYVLKARSPIAGQPRIHPQ